MVMIGFRVAPVRAPTSQGSPVLLAPRPWPEAAYDSVCESDDGYDADSVSQLSMLVMTGNWWEPLLLPEPSALTQWFAALAALTSVHSAPARPVASRLRGS